MSCTSFKLGAHCQCIPCCKCASDAKRVTPLEWSARILSAIAIIGSVVLVAWHIYTGH